MTSILGGMSPARFLRDHWQKRPLLVRQAIPGFAGFLARDDMFRLAERADATSRLVIEHPRRKRAQRWERHDGPFGGIETDMLPRSHWTLLVHGIESLVPGGWELLRRFSFIPSARIDDLMVSHAADGGSVGPHDDRYDVFLLQGPGRRRWQISTKRHRLDATAAIKVLADFRAEEEWVLEPGDMLYLPPGVAHWGVADGPCFTYSIGFLAPSQRELVQSFFTYLAANRLADALYEDPDLREARDPIELGDDMLARVARLIRDLKWTPADIEDFLGRFLTMPRPGVSFVPPRSSVWPRRGRLSLALPSRGLARGRRLFLNGASFPSTRVRRRLLAERSLALPVAEDPVLRDWLMRGWIVA